MDLILGLILGGLIVFGVITYFNSVQKKQLINSQSVILLEKIRMVCKFITVEGDFAEIYHYQDVKQRLLNLISSEKKALIVINAKAHIGYDLSKIKIKSDKLNKRIILEHFPQPEVLSIETNLNYYDKKDGYFNKFNATDLTDLNLEAKNHIQDKIPESGLLDVAKKEAMEAILLMENMVETIGWKLDYSALKIETESARLKANEHRTTS